MDSFQIYRNSSVEWNPSAVLALSTSLDASQVAAARADGSLEIWLVSPGSVGWHCQLTIQGNPDSRVSSLVWFPVPSQSTAAPTGRLFSSSIDGSVSEWDLFSLKQKVVLESIGVSIWQMAVEPCDDSNAVSNGFSKMKDEDDEDEEDKEDEENAVELNSVERHGDSRRVALGCDDGSVRLYVVSVSDGLTYSRSSLRVSGRILSVAWSLDAKLIFSGTSDGFIRCWDTQLSHELYRITVGVGGLGSGPEICIWSLLVLRCGTLVSGDSTGCVQFWDSCHGTLLLGHSYHKGDVNALATVPSNNRVFSAGSDGQIILYKLASDAPESGVDMSSAEVAKKWVYVGYVRAHTHDVRALTVAVPIIREDELPKGTPRPRQRLKPVVFTYHKWAHLGVPMLISAGDDTKLFAYSAKEFTKFAPHDICPTPQRPPIQLVCDAAVDGSSMVLIQCPDSLGLFLVNLHGKGTLDMSSKRTAITRLLARVKSKASRKIICSAFSSTGLLFAFSDHVKPSLFELIFEAGQSRWAIVKRRLPQRLPFAHAMVFTSDSSCLIVAGHDRKINVVGLESAELLHTFVPTRKDSDMNSPPKEPPITRMFTSSDGQWLAAVNCFGDIYIFNLELRRQHWFISRLDGASVTAGGFHPRNGNILVITTSSNRIYVFDVDAKQLGEWSRRHTPVLPRRFQEFPGEVIGISFPPSKSSTSVIVYSARAMCNIDFGMPVCIDVDLPNGFGHQANEASNFSKAISKRKHKELDQKLILSVNKNFNFRSFNDPVLFLGHLSENSVLIMDKPWLEVARTFDAPVHRHVFGS